MMHRTAFSQERVGQASGRNSWYANSLIYWSIFENIELWLVFKTTQEGPTTILCVLSV